jgi:hypothetical protein
MCKADLAIGEITSRAKPLQFRYLREPFLKEFYPIPPNPALQLFMRYSTALLLVSKAATASPFLAKVKTPHHVPEPWSPDFWYRILLSAVLVLAGGVFAGYVACV